MTGRPADVLLNYLPQLQTAALVAPILDLACGSGRNGLAMLRAGIDVTFADRDAQSLLAVQQAVAEAGDAAGWGKATYWEVDFEQPGLNPLAGRTFGGVVVFRYLHRALLAPIRQAVAPGGLVIYETFTVEQPKYGRPKNPDFLLRHGELESVFADWDVLLAQEGVERTAQQSAEQALARIVARKPA